jgi:hypothetical protein
MNNNLAGHYAIFLLGGLYPPLNDLTLRNMWKTFISLRQFPSTVTKTTLIECMKLLTNEGLHFSPPIPLIHPDSSDL